MSIKLFLICVWSVGVFSVRAAVPVEGIIYFKEGKSVGFSGDHRVCIPKKGKDVKAFRGIFTRDKQKEVYPAEEIDSIVCWHPRTPEFRRKFILAEGIGWCWQYFATPHIEPKHQVSYFYNNILYPYPQFPLLPCMAHQKPQH